MTRASDEEEIIKRRKEGLGSPVVYLISGYNTVTISGNPVVTSVSGNTIIANVSGNTITTQSRMPTQLRIRPTLTLSAASGGAQLLSGDIINAKITNAGLSGMNVWIGTTADPPFSGKGIFLPVGASTTINTSNFANLRACSVISGALLSYAGEQY